MKVTIELSRDNGQVILHQSSDAAESLSWMMDPWLDGVISETGDRLLVGFDYIPKILELDGVSLQEEIDRS